MKKAFLALMLVWLGMSSVLADDNAKVDEKKAIMAVVTGLFDAMREADADKHGALIAPNTTMDRVTANGGVERGLSEDWTNGIAKMKAGVADEQLHGVEIIVEGTLAMVWAPFTLNVNGVLRSCGVNQFSLVKSEEGWKVVYAIDIHTPQKCEAGTDQ